jgi:predicted regulator of Ras-like GTPase activity (Roadblock/LC7/MglB family)
MSTQIDPSIKALASEAVETIMREVKSAKAVVIATEDGFEIASKVENAAQTSRLSAMASSFSALGALVGEESQLGQCNNVIIDAAEGFILIMQIRHPKAALTMCVIAGKDSVMGQLLYFSKQAAHTVANA